MRYRTVKEFADTVLEGLYERFSLVPQASHYSALTLNSQIEELFEHGPEEIVETVGEMVMGFREKEVRDISLDEAITGKGLKEGLGFINYIERVLAHPSLHELIHRERENVKGEED